MIICAGIFLLSVLEKKESDRERLLSGEHTDAKYKTGVLAILFPILYCVIDGLGTFADAVYLDEMKWMSESEALLAYEFTFFLCAVVSYLYIRFVKKEKFNPLKEKEKGIAAIFETVGQFFYVFAIAGNAIIAAPVVASYSICSVVLSRIFLKEKLSKKQYVLVAVVFVGILLLGIADGQSSVLRTLPLLG